jgi:hypothetical protein
LIANGLLSAFTLAALIESANAPATANAKDLFVVEFISKIPFKLISYD